MTKKNYVCKNKENIQKIIGWTTPKLHQASECYVSFKVFDPCYGKLRLKKIMLGHIKGKRNQRVYGEALIKRITQKLLEGWNPWIEESNQEEYALFADVCSKYRVYLAKMVKEGGLKPGTLRNYEGKLDFLQKWLNGDEHITYIYQFNKTLISKFLDYVLVGRNNGIRTRNNYIGWLKSFSSYLVERGYVQKNPTDGINATTKLKHKNRDVIPNDVLRQLKSYLEKENKHFLLACYFLHYLFVRPGEMCSLRIRDVSVKNKTLSLSGANTKNGRDAVVTIPNHVIELMKELGIFSRPQNYYIFGNNFRPGLEALKARTFSLYWDKNVRKALNLNASYKFYSLKDTGITNMIKSKTDLLSVRDQARHSSVDITNIYTPQECKEANSALIDYEGVF
ncbi:MULTISPECIES: tyrosine-type recombinase/integrase [Segatella]|jgi:integrase|uniref:Tyrosine-type recombinase/integrase n=1 Tax=Segatella copri TaxID=165179 RepID=A0AAW4N1M4_9BACT|nr:site-specific integrase [Segatella copri]MBV3386247.1 tyrosine-type recombinase/integrase [Segatella copri]MBV3394279.1 tyrosine-type recombinase/integrase [Segatella copri]MBV3404033.1 tyrosine-type recombinase/integrase [Segatella copri]DAI53349.1 MAG TPA: Integrase [Bacteriophage sp.]